MSIIGGRACWAKSSAPRRARAAGGSSSASARPAMSGSTCAPFLVCESLCSYNLITLSYNVISSSGSARPAMRGSTCAPFHVFN